MTLIAISRHATTFGDTHRHMATHFPIWRQASQRRDSRENLITFCIQLVPVRMLSKRWRNKKGKSGSVATLSSSKMAERASVFPQVAAEVFRLAKQKRLSRYRDVISAVLSRFGDPRCPSAICVAIPQQLSRYGEASTCAMQAIVAHLAVPQPSWNRDFGRDSRRQSYAIGPLFRHIWGATTGLRVSV